MNIAEYTLQEAKILTANSNFQADVLLIRELYKEKDMPANGFHTEAELENWREKYVYYQKNANSEVPLDNGVSYILKKYNLGPDWRHAVKRYILLNDINKMQLPTKISGGPVMDNGTGRWRTVVYLPEYASTRDIRAAIPAMTEWQAMTREWNKMAKLKKKPIVYQDLGGEAAALHKQLKSYKKTAIELSKIHDKNISEERARDLVRNHNKRIGTS